MATLINNVADYFCEVVSSLLEISDLHFIIFTKIGPHHGCSPKRFRAFPAEGFLYTASPRLLLHLVTSLIVSTHSCLICMWWRTENPENYLCCRKWWTCNPEWFCGKRGKANHFSLLKKTINLILHPQLMYYIHNFFTQYVILLNIAVKDHNKTEVELAKTSLETTRLLNPVYIEKRFWNEFFLCENRKMLRKTLQRQPFACVLQITCS